MNLAGELCTTTTCATIDAIASVLAILAGIGISAGFGVMSYREGRNHLRLLRHGCRAPGRVVGVVTYQRVGGVRGWGSANRGIVPRVQYVTRDGETVVSAPRWIQRQSARRPLPVTVMVIYDPVEPRRMMIEHPGYISDPAMIVLSAGVGVAVSVLALCVLVLCLGCQLVR